MKTRTCIRLYHTCVLGKYFKQASPFKKVRELNAAGLVRAITRDGTISRKTRYLCPKRNNSHEAKLSERPAQSSHGTERTVKVSTAA